MLTNREIDEIAMSSSGKMNPAENIKPMAKDQDKSKSNEAKKEDKTKKGIVFATVEQPGKVKFSSDRN